MDLNGVARWVGLGRRHVAAHDQLCGCRNSEGPPDEDTCSNTEAEMFCVLVRLSQVSPYSPAYNTPDSPGRQPPPLSQGSLRRSQQFATEPAPLASEPFGDAIELTFELRGHSVRDRPSGNSVRIVAGNSTPLGRILDAAVSKAFATGTLQVSERGPLEPIKTRLYRLVKHEVLQ